MEKSENRILLQAVHDMAIAIGAHIKTELLKKYVCRVCMFEECKYDLGERRFTECIVDGYIESASFRIYGEPSQEGPRISCREGKDGKVNV